MHATLDAETLALIYEAALDPARWEEAILRIVRGCQSHGGQILIWDATAPGIAFSQMAGIGALEAVPAQRLFAQRDSNIDPGREHAMSLRVRQWIDCHPVFDDRFIATSEFYQGYFVAVLDSRDLFGTSLAEPNGLHAMLAVSRRRGGGARAFDEQTLRRLGSLTPHLSRAARLQLTMARLRGELDRRDAALDSLSLAILIVDHDATMRFVNTAAEACLQRATAPVGSRQGRLVARSSRDAMALSSAINGAIVDRRGATLVLGMGGATTLVCTVVPLSPRSSLGDARERSMALIVLNDPHAATPVDPQTLSTLFNLTPAEARLAAAVAGGESLSACAIRFGVSALTARAQLRTVFEKVGVHRQAELVALLQRLVSHVSMSTDPHGRP